MRVKRRPQSKTILLITAVILLSLLGSITYLVFRPKVVKSVSIEAGSPGISRVLTRQEINGSYVTDIDR